jgi:hypothetical protein
VLWTANWDGPRVSLKDVKNIKFLTLLGMELGPFPALRQSLFGLLMTCHRDIKVILVYRLHSGIIRIDVLFSI